MATGSTRILLLSRDLDQTGGVVKYCKSVLDHFRSDSLVLESFVIGRRPGKASNLSYLFTSLRDCLRLYLKLFRADYRLVHLNPSLGLTPALRDALFLRIAKLHGRKTLVFWHGWEKGAERRIDANGIVRWCFRRLYAGADGFVVLASAFREKLEGWGFRQPIHVETTTIDESLADGFDPEMKIQELRGTGTFRFLFFSRIQRTKGVFETVDAFLNMETAGRDTELVIAGDGPDYADLCAYVRARGDDRIKLVGYLTGARKLEILEQSHLLCLPTAHGEGLPISVLEAMAFAMPIVTCPVGGLPDVLEEGRNAWFFRPEGGKRLATVLSEVLADREKMAAMAMNNHHLARQFLSPAVAGRLAGIYETILNNAEKRVPAYGPAT